MATASSLTIAIVEHATPEYEETVALRNDVLRKPLGLGFTPEQLGAEGSDHHVACYEGEELVGCLILTPLEGGDLKMRQVAVATDRQGRGIGRLLVEFSEHFARGHGFHRILLHARESAAAFYDRLGYTREGAPFEEVTIPHWKMWKRL